MNIEKDSTGLLQYGDGTYWDDYPISNIHMPRLRFTHPANIALWKDFFIYDFPKDLDIIYMSLCQANPLNVSLAMVEM